MNFLLTQIHLLITALRRTIYTGFVSWQAVTLSTTRTTDLDMAKLYWNSMVSMENAPYTCLNIKKNYLMAAIEYFKYMKIPLLLLCLAWTIEQYNLKTLVSDG